MVVSQGNARFDLDGRDYAQDERVRGGQKDSGRGFSTPILFISSLTHSQHAIDGFDLGANDYIRKEVLLDEVGARVNRWLRNMGMLKVETDFMKISDDVSFNPIRRYLL